MTNPFISESPKTPTSPQVSSPVADIPANDDYAGIDSPPNTPPCDNINEGRRSLSARLSGDRSRESSPASERTTSPVGQNKKASSVSSSRPSSAENTGGMMKGFWGAMGFSSPTQESPCTSDSEAPDPKQDEAEEVLPETNKSLLFELISQLKVGMDLSKVALPTFLLETRSLLEKLTDLITYPHLLRQVNDQPDPLARIVQVVRFYMSGWHVRPKGVKKPYNPILGETFQCHLDLEGSSLHFFAEQVSHHPPISAIYIEDQTAGISGHGYYYPRSKFLGNSAASIGEGFMDLTFGQHDETYTITWPSAYARGIIFGALLMELGGKVHITCKQSGLAAEIDFKTKGVFGGEYNKVAGKIYRTVEPGRPYYLIEGFWNEAVSLRDTRTNKTSTLFATADETAARVVVPEVDPSVVNCSRSVWKDVTAALTGTPDPDLPTRNVEAATKAKQALEDQQRELRKKRAAASFVWKPQYFDYHGKDADGREVWRYKSKDHPLDDGRVLRSAPVVGPDAM